MYPAVARRFHTPLLPFLLQDVYGVPGNMQDDGIHPTEQGNQQVAANVEKLIQAAVTEVVDEPTRFSAQHHHGLDQRSGYAACNREEIAGPGENLHQRRGENSGTLACMPLRRRPAVRLVDRERRHFRQQRAWMRQAGFNFFEASRLSARQA